MSLPRSIQGKPWHESEQQRLAEDDLRRLHSIRAACRSLAASLHPADWFSCTSHDREYKTIIVKTVGTVPREAGAVTRWDSFPVRYQPQNY
jgi:hypothetical protein